MLPPDVTLIKKENSFPQPGDESDEVSGNVERISLKRRKKSKGFDGEMMEADVSPEASFCMMPLKDIPSASLSLSLSWDYVFLTYKYRSVDSIFTTGREFETTPNEDGGADTNVRVECTLADIAAATNLRIDDAAFALNECGLLMRRLSSGGEGEGEQRQVVVITRRLVEKVAKERNVKKMYLDLACVIP